MNLIQQIEAEEIAAFKAGKEHSRIPPRRHRARRRDASSKASAPAFRPTKACASPASNRGIGTNFTVRKMRFGEGVERVFPLYSPNIESITVVRSGVVRRAKLYYLRGRTGKRARIAERKTIKTGEAGQG